MQILRQIMLSCLLLLISTVVNAVELNSASAHQLMSLKGIGEKTAQAILQERQRAGPFISLEDFSIRVKGIGKKRLDNLVKQGLHISPTSVPHEHLISTVTQSKDSRTHANATDGVSHRITEHAVHFIQSTNNQATINQAITQRSGSGRIKTQRQKAGSAQTDLAEPKLIKPPR